MTAPRPLLESRMALVAAAVFFLCLSVWSWLSIAGDVRTGEDPVHILGYVFSVFIAASIACRSPSRADRAVFGAAAGAFLLILVKVAVPLTAGAVLAVNVSKSLALTAAALVSLIALLRRFRAPHRSGSS